jgi:Tol biopolymer transport system component
VRFRFFVRVGLSFLLLHALAAFARNSSAQIKSLAVSPDGKLIAVEYGKGDTSFIYKVNVDTGNATRLTDANTGTESGPAFSRDGKQIAYSYWPGNGAHSRIVIGNVDGSDLHSWPPSESSDYWPVLSPDRETIVFARSGYYGNYSPIARPYHHAWSFYASDLNGENVRPLTNENFYMASAPSVSADGKSMVVVTEDLDTPQKIAIYSLAHPGKPTLSLRPHVPKEADHKNPIFDYPNCMADGKSILFMAASNGRLLSGYDYDVYRVDIETGAVDRFTKGNGFATDLRVSADGKTAAFLKWRSDWRGTPVANELYLLDVETRKLTLLKINGLS